MPLQPPPSNDPAELRKWADYIFSQSSDECWLDAAHFRRFLTEFADKLEMAAKAQLLERRERRTINIFSDEGEF